MMPESNQPLAVLRTALPDLKRRWPIKSLALFGSEVRGEANSASDLDILVEFGRPLGLSEFLALEDALSALVNRRVDAKRLPCGKSRIDWASANSQPPAGISVRLSSSRSRRVSRACRVSVETAG
jgi:hypothetical protein